MGANSGRGAREEVYEHGQTRGTYRSLNFLTSRSRELGQAQGFYLQACRISTIESIYDGQSHVQISLVSNAVLALARAVQSDVRKLEQSGSRLLVMQHMFFCKTMK